jgi:hypothetical protein
MYDYSQCGQEKQWGKARECYQVGIDVDNLAEEFYQHPHMMAPGIGTISIFPVYLRLMTGFPSFQPEDARADLLH